MPVDEPQTQDDIRRETALMGFQLANGPIDIRPGSINYIFRRGTPEWNARLVDWNKAILVAVAQFIASGQAVRDAAGHLIIRPKAGH